MKSTNTRQPLHQPAADKTEKPFFSGSREKQKQGDAFFQAKKIDGNQDTAMEQEADAVAQKVTMAQQAPVKSSQRMGQMSVQKKGANEEKDGKAAQKKDKKDEKDEGKAQKKGDEEKKDEGKAQKKGDEEKKDEGKAQKKGDEEKKDEGKAQKKGDEEKKDEGKVQKKEKGDDSDKKTAAQKQDDQPAGGVDKTEGKAESPDAKFERLLNKSKDGGSPLPAKVRAQLEHQMNANFEKVRIHTGQEATELCNISKAQAFAHGTDIYFNSARFDPESSAGMNLLAHELTHIIQQNGSGK
ncbi:protein of unknown function [Mucilaginibacter pineti]|uniref:eCIS core domain-containing protein n=1 Tax=Mucilaginibacter pineti TaxID=1391627 RepID=A0A1G6WPP1_9SPHI|nr:DUF4157 domain-containing protein [Mucilaginibacter pineti]SDD67852.1 protein of unknown function [Mucilaginibacter pineti]